MNKLSPFLLLVCIQCLCWNAGAQQMIPKPSWLKDTVIAGIPVQQLRVPRAEITSSHWMDIVSIQHALDFAGERAREWKIASFNGTSSEIMILHQLDPSWPVEYYKKELDAFQAYNKSIPAHDRIIADSMLKVAREKERLARLTYGYCFISKPFVLLRENAFDGGRMMGKLYFGTYVKIEDADSAGDPTHEAYVTVPGLPGVEGIIHIDDYVDNLSKLNATDEEMSVFKSRQYAKFEMDPAYAAAIKKEQQAEARREQAQAASHGTSHPSKNRTYITGPRGGCYYINSNGNKVYVDHSYCQ